MRLDHLLSKDFYMTYVLTLCSVLRVQSLIIIAPAITWRKTARRYHSDVYHDVMEVSCFVL